MGAALGLICLVILGIPQADLSSKQRQADAIVQNLRDLPDPRERRPAATEQHRAEITSQLRELGEEGVAALARVLTDHDVVFRRNVLIAFYDLSHGSEARGVPRVDIRPAIPTLLAAFKDPDASVRAWSIQALTGIEPLPMTLMPAFDELLNDPDTGVRLSACGALGMFGIAAERSRQKLERLLADEDPDLRSCAGFVLNKIKGQGRGQPNNGLQPAAGAILSRRG